MQNFHKSNTDKPNVEQVSEFRNTTRRGSEPAPPKAARFGVGASNVNEIAEAATARRQQSNSWSNRFTGNRAVSTGMMRASE